MKHVAIHFINGEIRTMTLDVYLKIRQQISVAGARQWQLVNNEEGVFQFDFNLENVAFVEINKMPDMKDLNPG